MKASGARAKGREHTTGLSNGPSARAASAYASASPLDFQEPWRDEPEASSQNRRSVITDLKQRRPVAPAVSEDELPEDWEEAASAVELFDRGLEETTLADAEAAPEAAASAIDGASVDDHSPKTASRRPSDSKVFGTQDALSVDTLAHGYQAEAAAAASPASKDRDEGTREIAAAAASSHTHKGTAEAVSPVDGSQEGASAADIADQRQPALACAAQEPETSVGVADAAMPSACEGMLQSMLFLTEPRPASEAAVVPNPEPESFPNHLAVSDFSAVPGEEEAHGSAANECHGGYASSSQGYG